MNCHQNLLTCIFLVKSGLLLQVLTQILPAQHVTNLDLPGPGPAVFLARRKLEVAGFALARGQSHPFLIFLVRITFPRDVVWGELLQI